MKEDNINKKNLAVYPYNDSSYGFVKIAIEKKYFEIKKLISPIGWGINGKDAGLAYNREELGIKIESDILEALQVCDTLYIPNIEFIDSLYESVINLINLFLNNNKEVICAKKLDNKTLKKINYHSKYFKCLHNNQIQIRDEQEKVENRFLLEFKIPIIFVCDLLGDIGAETVALIVKEELCKRNYRTEVFVDNIAAEYIGAHYINCRNKNISETKKIIYINNFINQTIENNKADIAVVQIPNAIMRYNDKVNNGFGVMSFFYSQAINPDYIILCMDFSNINEKYINMINSYIKNMMGKDIDIICVSNCLVDKNCINTLNKISYLRINSMILQNGIDEFKKLNNSIKIQNLLDDLVAIDLVDNILKKLKKE